MVILEVIGPEGTNDQITFSVQQPELVSIKVNFYIGKPVRKYYIHINLQVND